MNRPASLNVTFVTLCILFSLTGMFWAAYYGGASPADKQASARDKVAAGPDEASAIAPPPSVAIPQAIAGQEADELAALMGKLRATPNDADVLRQIGEIFIAAREWSRAEFFLARAVLGRPGDIRPLYLYGISQYQQNKIAQAAKSFEDLLAIKEDPAAMFNLAIIYKYHTAKKAEAEALLRKIIDFPGSDAEVIAKARAEL